MDGLDRPVLIGCFGAMVAIGVWPYERVDRVNGDGTPAGAAAVPAPAGAGEDVLGTRPS